MGKGFALWRGFAREGGSAPQAIPAQRGYAGEARIGGCAAAPAARTGTLCPWRRRGAVKPAANRIISRTSQGDIPGRDRVKGAVLEPLSR